MAFIILREINMTDKDFFFGRGYTKILEGITT